MKFSIETPKVVKKIKTMISGGEKAPDGMVVINTNELNASKENDVKGYTLFMEQAMPVITDFINKHSNLKLEGDYIKADPEKDIHSQFIDSKSFIKIMKDDEEIGRIYANPTSIYTNIGGIEHSRASSEYASDTKIIVQEYLKALLEMPAVKAKIE